MNSFGRIVAVAAAIALTGGVGLGSAGAAPARPAVATASPYGAGYFTQPASGPTSVTARFKVPAITCASSTDVETLAPGVAFINNTVKFTTTVSLAAVCNLGSISYSTSVCPGGGALCVSGDAKPGDALVATITNSVGSAVGTMHNLTSKTITTATASFNPFNVYTLIGVLGPHGVANENGIPTFTAIKFSHAAVNGTVQGAGYLSQLNLESVSAVQIKSGNINPTSSAFKTTFVTNY